MNSEADAGGTPEFLTGLLLGALIGVTVAMLVAPGAGEETRATLRAKARVASLNARGAVDDLSDELSASASDLLARGKHIVEEARARFEGAVAEGKEAAAHQRSTLENEKA